MQTLHNLDEGKEVLFDILVSCGTRFLPFVVLTYCFSPKTFQMSFQGLRKNGKVIILGRCLAGKGDMVWVCIGMKVSFLSSARYTEVKLSLASLA